MNSDLPFPRIFSHDQNRSYGASLDNILGIKLLASSSKNRKNEFGKFLENSLKNLLMQYIFFLNFWKILENFLRFLEFFFMIDRIIGNGRYL